MGAILNSDSLVNAPLREHCVLRSDSFGEVHSFLKHKNLELHPSHIKTLSEDFHATINAAYMPNIYVAYMEYGAEMGMTALAPLDTDYGIHLPIRGRMKSQIGRQSVQCGEGHTVVTSPASRISLTASTDCERLLLCVGREALTNLLAVMLGDVPAKTLVFAPDANPGNAYSQRLGNAVRYAAQEFDCKESVTENGVVVEQFEQFLMTLLLMSQPSNYSDMLNKRDNGVGSKDVKKAIDYIRSNLGFRMTLEDLVAASGVPGRTLYQHFHDFTGTSPMAYIKKARYEQVHQDLLSSDGENTVTEIAGRWGFAHMGRFAAEYRQRYGELPSETARRRSSAVKRP